MLVCTMILQWCTVGSYNIWWKICLEWSFHWRGHSICVPHLWNTNVWCWVYKLHIMSNIWEMPCVKRFKRGEWITWCGWRHSTCIFDSEYCWKSFKSLSMWYLRTWKGVAWEWAEWYSAQNQSTTRFLDVRQRLGADKGVVSSKDQVTFKTEARKKWSRWWS